MKVTKTEMSIAIKVLQAFNDGNLDLDCPRYDELAAVIDEAGRIYYDELMDEIQAKYENDIP